MPNEEMIENHMVTGGLTATLHFLTCLFHPRMEFLSVFLDLLLNICLCMCLRESAGLKGFKKIFFTNLGKMER